MPLDGSISANADSSQELSMPRIIVDFKSIRFSMTIQIGQSFVLQNKGANSLDDVAMMRFIKELPFPLLLTFFALAGFTGMLIWDHSYWWSAREDYSFGYLVPVFAGYMIYERWPQILKAWSALFDRTHGAAESLLITRLAQAVFGLAGAFGLLLFVFGAFIRAASGHAAPASFLMAFSMPLIWGCFLFFVTDFFSEIPRVSVRKRIQWLLLFLFSVFIWLLSSPLPGSIEFKLKLFLLQKVTVVVFFVYDLLGFSIEREGNVLLLPTGRVGVEEACSGIRSLTGCIFSGCFLAAVFLKEFWRKALLIILAVCLAIFTNLLRSLFLTGWAYAYGSDAIGDEVIVPVLGSLGTLHDLTGFLVLGLTVVLLLMLLPVVNFRLQWDEPVDSDAQVSTESDNV
jgi:exosortase